MKHAYISKGLDINKIYIFLLLTTQILSTSCMELQRYPSINNDATEIPLTIFHQMQSNIQEKYNEIIQTNNWSIYNKIMDMPYKHDQQTSVITNTTDLAPVYLPIVHKDKMVSTKKITLYLLLFFTTTNQTQPMEWIKKQSNKITRYYYWQLCCLCSV